LATRSRVAHTAIITSTAGDLVEAEPGGARVANITEYSGRYIVVSSVEESTPEQRQLVVDAALHMVGVPYSDLAILDDGLESLGMHWAWLARLASNHGIICSGMAASCGAVAGLTDWMCGKKQPSEVTPADLGRRPGVHRLIV
jgi:hypothetical protein